MGQTATRVLRTCSSCSAPVTRPNGSILVNSSAVKRTGYNGLNPNHVGMYFPDCCVLGSLVQVRSSRIISFREEKGARSVHSHFSVEMRPSFTLRTTDPDIHRAASPNSTLKLSAHRRNSLAHPLSVLDRLSQYFQLFSFGK